MWRILVCCIVLFGEFVGVWAGPLLPRPQSRELSRGYFRTRSLRVLSPCLAEELASFLRQRGVVQSTKSSHSLELRLVDTLVEVKQNYREGYRLEVTPLRILLEAQDSLGLYRGLQTLSQLWDRGGVALECQRIVDWPAFEVRGLMQDVGRTFIPLDELKHEIEHMARYKLNVFHWHLTENQAWRLESKIYPELTDARVMERMPGKYYTQAEARELVEYCKERRILLLPEIDMPGHSAAFSRAMGCDMQSPRGREILKELLTELCGVLEVPYIHIGTDEVAFRDSLFVPEMVAYLRALGKKVVSWSPGWHYKSGEIDMIQMWSYRGLPTSGVPAIDSRLHYINHFDLFADLVMLYGSRIYNQPCGSDSIAGTILALWNDRTLPSTADIVAQNNLYASLLAMAERSWLGGGYGYFDSRDVTLYEGANPYFVEEFGDFEKRMLWHKERYFSSDPFPYVGQSHAVWFLSDVYNNSGNLGQVFDPELRYLSDARTHRLLPPYFAQVTTDSASLYPCYHKMMGSGAYLRHVWGDGRISLVPDAKPNSTVYATAWVYSSKEQSAGLIFGTQDHSRSEKDLPPPQGKWDYRESRLWINGEEIAPPRWTATHTEPSNEIPMGNENATARAPLPISLHRGWNQIFIKLPVGEFRTREVRLIKWMFTAAITVPDGSRSLHLRYWSGGY